MTSVEAGAAARARGREIPRFPSQRCFRSRRRVGRRLLPHQALSRTRTAGVPAAIERDLRDECNSRRHAGLGGPLMAARLNWRLVAFLAVGFLPFVPSILAMESFLLADNALGFVPFVLPLSGWALLALCPPARGAKEARRDRRSLFRGAVRGRCRLCAAAHARAALVYFWLHRVDLLALPLFVLAAGFVFFATCKCCGCGRRSACSPRVALRRRSRAAGAGRGVHQRHVDACGRGRELRPAPVRAGRADVRQHASAGRGKPDPGDLAGLLGHRHVRGFGSPAWR